MEFLDHIVSSNKYEGSSDTESEEDDNNALDTIIENIKGISRLIYCDRKC